MKKPNIKEIMRKLAWRSKRDMDETSLMEKLEDYYGVDLTNLYGEDYSDPKIIKKLKQKLRI